MTVKCLLIKTLYLFLAPEGVAPPSVAVVSETTIRVSWVAPLKPNGQIIGYFIHVINNKIPTDMTVPGSYLVTNLLPYTVYSIKVYSYSNSCILSKSMEPDNLILP